MYTRIFEIKDFKIVTFGNVDRIFLSSIHPLKKISSTMESCLKTDVLVACKYGIMKK